jgi:hypothetical protein
LWCSGDDEDKDERDGAMEPGALPGPEACGCEYGCGCGCWYWTMCWEWEYDDGCGVIGAEGGRGGRVGTARTSVCARGRFCDIKRWFTEDVVGVAVIPRRKSAQVGWKRVKARAEGRGRRR